MNELQKLSELLKNKSSMVALLAPSFPIVFNPTTICGQLNRLGFENIVEVSVGAKQTNTMLVEALNNDINSRFITSPCPNIVRIIRSKYPQAIPYLATSIDSPMIASAKIVKQKFPNKQIVFIGPCLVKKLEASEDYPELNILCVTYKDIQQLFLEKNIREEDSDKKISFDITNTNTRLYPISGGLAQSSGVRDMLAEEDIQVVSGPINVDKAINNFLTSKNIRLLDILFCDGGCINGAGINSPLSTDQRRKKISDYFVAGLGVEPRNILLQRETSYH